VAGAGPAAGGVALAELAAAGALEVAEVESVPTGTFMDGKLPLRSKSWNWVAAAGNSRAAVRKESGEP
jgi:hypothetical protein